MINPQTFNKGDKVYFAYKDGVISGVVIRSTKRGVKINDGLKDILIPFFVSHLLKKLI